MIHSAILLAALLILPLAAGTASPATPPTRVFHLDASSGDDRNDGLSPQGAWKSLSKTGSFAFAPGDALLLKRGSRFTGTLKLSLQATAEQPFAIAAYGEGVPPVIDSKGYLAGVHLINCRYVTVRDLEVTADGGTTLDGAGKTLRYGVYVQATGSAASSHVTLENLSVHTIFPELGTISDGSKPTSFRGTAIAIHGRAESPSEDFVVRGCRIARTGFKAVELRHLRNAQVLDNRMREIGGPAIQPGNVDDLLVRGNIVDGSGSSADPRMHGRGSGIWPWTCKRVLIEENKFMHARGPADSCGVHIDFNCRDVVVQYNFTQDNEGGFIEILGNNHNCAYRYNISVNDGARVKGQHGAHQEGKVLWTSGYVGRQRKKDGPYNSYLYNNTIYVGPGSRSCFSLSTTTRGLLIANNIFHLMGRTEHVLGDQDARIDKSAARIPGVVMRNNLYLRESVLPPRMPATDGNMIIGDPRFAKPGGGEAGDYIPRDAALVRDRGMPIQRLDGDEVGLRIGLAVTKDFFGNPIKGNPDLGAIELP